MTVTGHLSEGSFVWNGVVEIPKFDAKPNSNPNPMPIRFGQVTLWTSELSPLISNSSESLCYCWQNMSISGKLWITIPCFVSGTGTIPVHHSGGPPFRRSARVNPNPDPQNGGPTEWRTPGIGGRYDRYIDRVVSCVCVGSVRDDSEMSRLYAVPSLYWRQRGRSVCAVWPRDVLCWLRRQAWTVSPV